MVENKKEVETIIDEKKNSSRPTTASYAIPYCYDRSGTVSGRCSSNEVNYFVKFLRPMLRNRTPLVVERTPFGGAREKRKIFFPIPHRYEVYEGGEKLKFSRFEERNNALVILKQY